jgi:hypothetical protein
MSGGSRAEVLRLSPSGLLSSRRADAGGDGPARQLSAQEPTLPHCNQSEFRWAAKWGSFMAELALGDLPKSLFSAAASEPRARASGNLNRAAVRCVQIGGQQCSGHRSQPPQSRRFRVLLLVATGVRVASAAEIRFLCAGALRTVIPGLVLEFEKSSGHKVTVTYGGWVG